MAYKPMHIKRWIHQINYSGETFHDYYVAAWRFFRCSPRERANFDYIRLHLADSGADDDSVIEVSFTDAVMGFRYAVLVHESADKALKMADMFAKRVEKKGSLDPENEIIVDRKSIRHTWARCGLEARVHLCREAGVSIFAARKQTIPEKYAAEIYTYMSEVEE